MVADKSAPVSDIAAQPPNDLLAQIRRLLDNTSAQYTCAEQEHGIVSCLRLDHDVILALGSGAGKSLAAIVPSLYEDAITVIMAASYAVLQAWTERLDATGIDYDIFLPGSQGWLTGCANIVLVSVAVAKGRHWKAAIQNLIRKGRVISRVVLDEAHMAITCNFWKSLRDIHEIRFVPSQVVLLTSTIPPKTVPWFFRQFALIRPVVIRGRTERDNIAHLIDTAAGDLSATAQLVQTRVVSLMRQARDDDRYIILVATAEDGMRLAECLHLHFYDTSTGATTHSAPQTLQRDGYDRWVRGERIGIVTNNARGLVKEYPHVRVVAHIGTPLSVIHYQEACGSAGRDGRIAYFVVFRSPQMPPLPRSQSNLCQLSGYYVIR
ncbi:uncharacterized protein SCHCODRAFT_02493441, partial [Schizophyllum commune H4-8]|uniref:uncharacterized protein n=1 Tax=Schizophyllum commune (strain H4-8 / FGSC 9210) TaxID=578458 RepID=UPI0021609D12